jgi:2Fe-2S ferredoxin
MEAAVENEVNGIDAQCYGACVCGTCHVYVSEDWSSRVGVCSEWEREVLAGLPLSAENSRLSCQILMHDDLDGLTIYLPLFQGDGVT